jgi:membrane protein
MRRVEGLLGWVDRVQQRSRWLSFPLAVLGKFRDDHGGALTTVIAYNAFFAFFPLLLSW